MYNYKTFSTRFNAAVPSELNCRTISSHPNYFIDRNGNVYSKDTGRAIRAESYDTIFIDNVRCQISRILMEEYTGILPLPIIDRSKPPISHSHQGYRSSALTYWVDTSKIIETDDDTIWIEQIQFRRIPFARTNVFISMNGVVYDRDYNDFYQRQVVQGDTYVHIPFDVEKREGWGPKRDTYTVIQLIYMAFVGPIKEGYVVTYIDDVSKELDLNNIKYISRLENYRAQKAKRYNSRPPEEKDPVWDVPFERALMIAEAISLDIPTHRIAEVVRFPYNTPEERHRVASIIYKIKSVPGYYDDLKEKFGLN